MANIPTFENIGSGPPSALLKAAEEKERARRKIPQGFTEENYNSVKGGYGLLTEIIKKTIFKKEDEGSNPDSRAVPSAAYNDPGIKGKGIVV